MPQKKSVVQIKKALTPIFEAYGIKSAVLFGSTAKGTNSDASDIDLLVDSGLKGLRFVGLMEAVRNAASAPVDLLDISHIEKNSKIEREIKATGVVIYEK